MPGEGFAGANVTVPHKHAALALADASSEAAREIGAANTLIFGATSGIAGRTTPTPAACSPRCRVAAGARALVLGAGGAARAAVWALAARGRQVERLEPHRGARAEPVASELGEAGPGRGRRPTESTRRYELIVNTTAVGLHGEDPFAELPLRRDGFAPGPGRRRHGLRRERRRRCSAPPRPAGATAVDGIEILVQQGALSLQIWTGREPPLDVMRAAARAER